MSDGLKKVLKTVLILLGLCAICFVGIIIIAETTWFHGDLINPGNSGNHNNQNILTPGDVQTPPQRTVEYLEEVPEYISDRGVILLGGSFLQEVGPSFRHSPDGGMDFTDGYVTDCNLSIESSYEDLVDFCERFSDFSAPVYDEDGTSASFIIPNLHYNYCFTIYRSCTFREEDLSVGGIYFDGGDGAYGIHPTFYDPTGRFIFHWEVGITTDEVMLPILLRFLEPEMTEVKYEPDRFGDGEAVIITAPEDISGVLDVMHALELTLETEDRSELAMAENQSALTFTDINGYVNEYIIIGDYMIHGEDVYFINNPDELEKLNGLVDLVQDAGESTDISGNDE